MILHHVSPVANAKSIALAGVDPIFSRGARRVSWWVADEKLMWAVVHVCTKFELTPQEVEVWTANSEDFPTLIRFAMQGVYYTPCRVMPALRRLAAELGEGTL